MLNRPNSLRDYRVQREVQSGYFEMSLQEQYYRSVYARIVSGKAVKALPPIQNVSSQGVLQRPASRIQDIFGVSMKTGFMVNLNAPREALTMDLRTQFETIDQLCQGIGLSANIQFLPRNFGVVKRGDLFYVMAIGPSFDSLYLGKQEDRSVIVTPFGSDQTILWELGWSLPVNADGKLADSGDVLKVGQMTITDLGDRIPGEQVITCVNSLSEVASMEQALRENPIIDIY